MQASKNDDIWKHIEASSLKHAKTEAVSIQTSRGPYVRPAGLKRLIIMF